MIKKKGGKAEVLKQNRFIHMKEGLARACEALVVGKIKEPLLDQSTIFQIGGQRNHSLEEHVFTLKSLIGLMEYRGDGLILTLVDIISFFDREDILDIMETFYKKKINKKAARLWYKLSENTEIRVKTAVGMSKTAKVGAVVGQGSSGAALASQAMVDSGLEEYFAGSAEEMYYGGVRVETAAYQDDICKPNSDTISAQIGMTRLSAMLAERGLEAHEDKTGYILFGSDEFKKNRKRELDKMPLNFGSFKVKQKSQDKYLGQVLHQGGLAQSVKSTIMDRVGKVKGAIYLTKQVIETVQMQAISGMMAAKEIWERAIVPSLLSGAGTWIESTVEAEEMCEELQELFWRVMMEIPRSTPKVMLTAKTNCMKMKHRIWQQKLLTARSISMKEGSLAKAVYDEQIEMGWPGLVKECEKICEDVGLKHNHGRVKDKTDIEEYIFYHNYKEMKQELASYKKLEEIKNEDFREIQKYMEIKAIAKVRMAFRIRSKMVKKIKMNFKSMHSNLNCEKCEMKIEESQAHTMMCPGWEEERRGLDLHQIEDTVLFFTRVLKDKGRKEK